MRMTMRERRKPRRKRKVFGRVRREAKKIEDTLVRKAERIRKEENKVQELRGGKRKLRRVMARKNRKNRSGEK